MGDMTLEKQMCRAARGGIAYLVRKRYGILIPGTEPVPLAAGKGWRVTRPNETYNHNRLARSAFLAGQACTGALEVGVDAALDSYDEEQRLGHRSLGNRDEGGCDSHDAWDANGPALDWVLAVVTDSEELERRAVRWMRRDQAFHLAHRIGESATLKREAMSAPAGRERQRMHPPPPRHVACRGARDSTPGIGGHQVNVSQQFHRDLRTAYIAGDLAHEPDATTALDLTFLWCFKVLESIELGTVRHALAEIGDGDMPRFRYGYTMYESDTERLAWWSGDLSAMQRPAFWMHANLWSGQEYAGCNPKWSHEDTAHKDPPPRPPIPEGARKVLELEPAA